MTDDDALLATILANPDDDLPRLVYADWLQERGHEEQWDRGEFIRVQCELARIEPCRHGWLMEDGPDCSYCRLSREDDWYQHNPDADREPPKWRAPSWLNVEGSEPLSFAIRWSRGFVESVSCPWSAWRDHGDAILSKHPVTKVRLTTEPEYFTFDNGLKIFHFGPERKKHQFVDLIGQILSRRDVLNRLLRAEWPTVREWELPEEEVDPMFHAFYGSNRREGAITVNEARAIRARR